MHVSAFVPLEHLSDYEQVRHTDRGDLPFSVRDPAIERKRWEGGGAFWDLVPIEKRGHPRKDRRAGCDKRRANTHVTDVVPSRSLGPE